MAPRRHHSIRGAIATRPEGDAVLATDAGFVALTSAWHPDGEICEPLLWFSADGNTWDLVSPDSPFGEMAVVQVDDLWGIAERDGRFVAIGRVGGQGQVEEQAAIWVSDDGLIWQRFERGPRPRLRRRCRRDRLDAHRVR